MSTPIERLRILDGSSPTKELDLASELFHRINRILPENQKMYSVKPTQKACEVIPEMLTLGYSQVPVVENGKVLGVFSFRSFADKVVSETLDSLNKQRCAPGELEVDEFLEAFEYCHLNEEMKVVFGALDRDNGILVGTPDNIIGILTPMDLLTYLDGVASHFVMLSEIELALRALIRLTLTEDQIAMAAQRCLSVGYGGKDNVPTRLENMTFDNYTSIICHGDNWTDFVRVFGSNRARTQGKLKEIGAIRNDLFHFKRKIKMQDHQTLAGHRNWLLSKIEQAKPQVNMETQP